MSDTPLFSVVVIARNESATLPRLVASLKEFQSRGGEIIVLDTGSTDGTSQVALDLKCKVVEATFTKQIGMEEERKINCRFMVTPDAKIVNEGDKYFDFAAARNFAAALASNDWIAMPDCDEVYTGLDIDKINAAIRAGTDQFEYDFVFSHGPDGEPAIQFRHCKFYNRTRLLWTGVIHEVLAVSGPWSPTREYVDYIKLEHWQNPSTNRGQYLTGLAVDCFLNPDNDRNCHYFARELMWSGRLNSAIDQFERHLEMKHALVMEKSQSLVFIGECNERQGKEDTAKVCYLQAFDMDPRRREAPMRLAELSYKKREPEKVRFWAEAALTIPYDPGFYGNQMHHYTWYPYEMLYWAYFQLGETLKAGANWGAAIARFPTSPKFLHDARFFMELPKVHIVVPHVIGTRQESLEKLKQLIKQNANYPDDKIHLNVEMDPGHLGCPKTFNMGVNLCFPEPNDLIMFLGDDCEPQEGFLIQAVRSHLQFKFDRECHTAVTALNDGLWNGRLATHWIADAEVRLTLPDRKFLHEGYHHVGCDNELTAWAKKSNRYNYAEHAKIIHRIADDEVHAKAWDANKVSSDRKLLYTRCELYALDKKDALCDWTPAGPSGESEGV